MTQIPKVTRSIFDVDKYLDFSNDLQLRVQSLIFTANLITFFLEFASSRAGSRVWPILRVYRQNIFIWLSKICVSILAPCFVPKHPDLRLLMRDYLPTINMSVDVLQKDGTTKNVFHAWHLTNIFDLKHIMSFLYRADNFFSNIFRFVKKWGGLHFTANKLICKIKYYIWKKFPSVSLNFDFFALSKFVNRK